MGHRVRIAYRGVMAIDITKHFLPDIVLIDFARPDAGLAVAAAIRRMQVGRSASLVGLVASGTARAENLAPAGSLDACLAHPLTRDALEQMLEHWCERVHGWRAGSA